MWVRGSSLRDATLRERKAVTGKEEVPVGTVKISKWKKEDIKYSAETKTITTPGQHQLTPT